MHTSENAVNATTHRPLFQATPYPSLIAADYLAAVGARDTAVLVIDGWIDEKRKLWGDVVSGYGPQLGWYMIRGLVSEIAIPYRFKGLIIPHRRLVASLMHESEALGTVLLHNFALVGVPSPRG